MHIVDRDHLLLISRGWLDIWKVIEGLGELRMYSETQVAEKDEE